MKDKTSNRIGQKRAFTSVIRPPPTPLQKRLAVVAGLLELSEYTISRSRDTDEQSEALELKKLLLTRKSELEAAA